MHVNRSKDTDRVTEPQSHRTKSCEQVAWMPVALRLFFFFFFFVIFRLALCSLLSCLSVRLGINSCFTFGPQRTSSPGLPVCLPSPFTFPWCSFLSPHHHLLCFNHIHHIFLRHPPPAKLNRQLHCVWPGWHRLSNFSSSLAHFVVTTLPPVSASRIIDRSRAFHPLIRSLPHSQSV